MSEFQLAQAQKEIAEDVLGVKHVVNTSRNAINNFNKKLGKELHVKTTDNPTLTNLIKDTAKMKKANVHYEPNTSLWYKIDGDTLYIRGHEAEGYSERILYTDETLSNNGWVSYSNKNDIIKAVIEEEIVPVSCTCMFNMMQNLKTIENFDYLKITHYCKSCARIFNQCFELPYINVSKWDVCNVTDMNRAFQGIGYNNNSYLCGFDDWNVSKVKYFNAMFKHCRNTIIDCDFKKWNTSSAVNMNDMFSFCKIITTLNLSNWNVSNVTIMKQMFYNSYNLKSVGDLSKWNAPKCTNARFMFGGDSQVDNKMKFTSLTLNNLFNNGIIEDISCMFQKCYDLKSVGNLDDWNTSNVTDMSWMFNRCRQLKSIGNLSKWDVSNVVNMYSMFRECCSLDNIGNLNDWNTSNVTNMVAMFGYNLNAYDDNGNAMNKEQYKEGLGINNIPTTISIPPIHKDCNISYMFDRQKFIEDVVYCGKISQSFTTKYGGGIQDNMSSLTRESIIKIINALDPENPGTLTLCEPNYEKLTDEDKAIATSKGWTIAA